MAPLERTIVFAVALAGVALSAHWSDVSTGLPATVGGLRALVVDNAGSSLYASTTGGSMFKSTDAGADWTAISNITGVLTPAIDPTSASTVYVALRPGVFKSTDGGASWQAAGLSDAAVSLLVVDPSRPSTIYASDGKKLYKSTDGAQSWAEIGLGLPAPGSPPLPPFISNITVDPGNPSTLFSLVSLGPPGSELYKSTNGGQTWDQVNAGRFASPLVIAADSTVYTLRFDRSLVRSTGGRASASMQARRSAGYSGSSGT